MSVPPGTARGRRPEEAGGAADRPPGAPASALYEALRTVASRRAEATAVRTTEGEHLDYTGLLRLVDRISGGLWARGVRPDTAVAFRLRNGIGYVALVLAVARVGARYVPLLGNFDDSAVRAALARTRPVLLVTDGHRVTPAAGLPTVSPDALAASAPLRVTEGGPRHTGVFRTLWTSGSTEFPKLIAWRQDKFLAERLRWIADTGIAETDVFACRHPLDVAHATDLHMFAALLSGAELVLIDPHAPAADLLQRLRHHRVTVMSALPRHYEHLVGAGERARRTGADASLPHLRLPLCGGAYLGPAVVRRAGEVLGIRIRQVYGSTEFGLALGDTDGARRTAPGMVPVSGVSARLAPLAGHGRADVGELVLRSDCTSEGYLHHDEANNRTFRGGEFWTGDLAHRAADGGYRILGRVTDALTGLDGPVTAPMLDEEMTASGTVDQAVVLPVRPGGFGREVYVAVRAGRLRDEAARAVAEVLAHHGLKGTVRFTGSIPMTPVGKIDKPLLRRMFEKEATPG
ncbi:class I adenylate-forming enzyme family protein [Streptomyces sp. I6]|uniref:class I adenylate-forming enzyme family protein n=1 Tax=Streptomyces sp. I6 TaxID=2483113 RepID=UPI000F44A2F8|nr:AMP-binding protein [Streptomyces sp. I6]RNL73340.1 hypothetical protein EBF04_25130 [Streptomyces sp. I6]